MKSSFQLNSILHILRHLFSPVGTVSRKLSVYGIGDLFLRELVKILLNEKLLQLCLILAIFLCLLLELISQPGQTLLKFKGSGGKSNDFSLLWILNVAIFVCSSIICFHMLLKTYESFRPNSGSRLEEWWYFWLLLLELCHPNYLHTILCQGTFYQIIWKSLV